jgi:dihydrofolate synthase/folylpolyglutamate synthase
LSVAPHLKADAESLLAPRLEQRIVPGLERTLLALETFGQPQRRFASVLILGTNGKGSTAALLASMLQACGVRTGLYTSPHLVSVRERIRLDGAAVSDRRLADTLTLLDPFPQLTYFEALTVAAFLEFAAQGVEVAVVEAGLGGRWDASSTSEPVVSLLTNVGTDHQNWLGTSRAAIAAEKAVAMRGLEAIVGSWDAEVEEVVRTLASPVHSLTVAEQWARAEAAEAGGVRFATDGAAGKVRMPLVGRHQLANLSLALAGVAALARHGVIPHPDGAALGRGITATRWPGRLQWHAWRGRRLLLDGAHNLEAVAALSAALDELGLSGTLHLLFSCLADKPSEAMAALLSPRAASVTVVPLATPRAKPERDLAAAFPGCAVKASVADALASLPHDRRPVLVCGSLRLVGEVIALTGARLG